MVKVAIIMENKTNPMRTKFIKVAVSDELLKESLIQKLKSDKQR